MGSRTSGESLREVVKQYHAKADGQCYVDVSFHLIIADVTDGRRALAAGIRRLDFLRGDEPYKYVWGSVDEPIQRLLVRRRNG